MIEKQYRHITISEKINFDPMWTNLKTDPAPDTLVGHKGPRIG